MGERLARVLDRDRIHIAAVGVVAYLDHASLDRRHPVGVGEVRHGEADAAVAPHVLGLPRRVVCAEEDVLALQRHPDDPVARRAVGAQRREVHEVRFIEERTNVGGYRDRHLAATSG
jgi:hypothetical protein